MLRNESRETAVYEISSGPISNICADRKSGLPLISLDADSHSTLPALANRYSLSLHKM